jgi:hypothetical protein
VAPLRNLCQGGLHRRNFRGDGGTSPPPPLFGVGGRSPPLFNVQKANQNFCPPTFQSKVTPLAVSFIAAAAVSVQRQLTQPISVPEVLQFYFKHASAQRWQRSKNDVMMLRVRLYAIIFHPVANCFGSIDYSAGAEWLYTVLLTSITLIVFSGII